MGALTPRHGVTVGIATTQKRAGNGSLDRTMDSIWHQTRVPELISIRPNPRDHSESEKRLSIADGLTTPWVIFIRDADQLLPGHVENLLAAAEHNNADVVYPWYYVGGGIDPYPQYFKRPWDPEYPISFPLGALMRAEVAQRCGKLAGDVTGRTFGHALASEGVSVFHYPNRSWIWHMSV